MFLFLNWFLHIFITIELFVYSIIFHPRRFIKRGKFLRYSCSPKALYVENNANSKYFKYLATGKSHNFQIINISYLPIMFTFFIGTIFFGLAFIFIKKYYSSVVGYEHFLPYNLFILSFSSIIFLFVYFSNNNVILLNYNPMFLLLLLFIIYSSITSVRYGLIGLVTILLLWFYHIYLETVPFFEQSSSVNKNIQNGFYLFLCSELMFFFPFFWAYFSNALSPELHSGLCWPPMGV